MRSIFATIAVLLLGTVAATVPSRTYLPPQLHVQLPQNVYLPPSSPSVYRPLVQQQLPQYVSRPQLILQRPLVQQVQQVQQVQHVQQLLRPQNVYLPPQNPALSVYSQPALSRTYLPPAAVGQDQSYDIGLRG